MFLGVYLVKLSAMLICGIVVECRVLCIEVCKQKNRQVRVVEESYEILHGNVGVRTGVGCADDERPHLCMNFNG